MGFDTGFWTLPKLHYHYLEVPIEQLYLVHPEIPPPPQQTTCFIANLIQNYSPETG